MSSEQQREPRKRDRDEKTPSEFQEVTLLIDRNVKVVKGGRNFSFAAYVAVGNGKGKIGFGQGKAKEVPEAIRKATEEAKKNMADVSIVDETLPHPVTVRFKNSQIIMKPAKKGTGVVAGGAVSQILKLAGVHNVTAKLIGNNNPKNVAKATINGLLGLQGVKDVLTMRGKING